MWILLRWKSEVILFAGFFWWYEYQCDFYWVAKRKINVEKKNKWDPRETGDSWRRAWYFFSNSMDGLFMYQPPIFPSEQSNIFFSNPLPVWGPYVHSVPLLHLGLWELILLQGAYLISLLVVATVNLFSIFPGCPRSLRELPGEPWIELSLLDIVQSLSLHFFLRWSSL